MSLPVDALPSDAGSRGTECSSGAEWSRGTGCSRGTGLSRGTGHSGGRGHSRGTEQQLAELRAIRSRPVLGAGQFSVRVREGGRLRRVGGVSWFRTDLGAYLATVAPGRGGADWMNLVPTDSARLAARLAELLG
ncbi:hypothetical protein FB470_006337 [Amycolatopsis thermophila]|uniref:ESX secretion-associated protein EspG n=1 Tax=Amycolatopsis thermophila TaxID=206084 RepID=A0ABU0F4N3_9PSEU|nr:hypothetical protein [Amycolatopsis thermophila]